MYQAQRKYGCKPSVKHIADLHYATAASAPTEPVFSWRPHCAPSYDQGQTGSCTGQSSSGVIALARELRGMPRLPSHPSQYYLYANARIAEGTLDQDVGATIRDVAMQAVALGYCDNTLWDSNNVSNLLLKPDAAAYTAAAKDEGSGFMWIGQTGQALVVALKTAIAGADPVLFGIQVYESFESAQVAHTGRVPMPQVWEQLLGGHALKMMGWNDHIQCFEVQNSWGTGWGDHGFCWLPYSYIKNQRLASEFGALRLVA